MTTSKRNGSKTRSRRRNSKASNKLMALDEEDRSVTEYEDSDETVDAQDDDDDTIDENYRPTTTTQLVEESNMQVLFSETTSREMKEIMQWWTSEEHDHSQNKVASSNTLLCISSSEEADEQGAPLRENSSEEEKYSAVSARPLLIDLGSDDGPEMPKLLVEDTKDEVKLGDNHLKTPANSNNLLIDNPRPQDVTFFSPFQDEKIASPLVSTPRHDGTTTSFGFDADDMTECSFRTLSDADSLHESVCMQNDEVTRLLLQTRAMADQVVSLTETSATEDDDDDSDRIWVNVAEVVSEFPPRRNIRRRRRKSTNGDSLPIKPFSSEECFKLEWHHHGRIWMFRQLMRLEMLVVSKILVPLVPLPFLLRILHRPKALRSVLVTSLLLITVVLPLFVWWHFPAHTTAIQDPLPSLRVDFNNEPYCPAESEAAFPAFSNNPVQKAIGWEGEGDYGFL